jgi:hypothetical protein
MLRVFRRVQISDITVQVPTPFHPRSHTMTAQNVHQATQIADRGYILVEGRLGRGAEHGRAERTRMRQDV